MVGPAESLEGRVVGGDFEVQQLIAVGGMGAVYEAAQRSTGKARALKVLHAWLLRDDKVRARFIDEARIAGSIDSDHVVEVVSAGIDPALDAPWIAMELLRGRTLTEHVAEVGALSAEQCLEVLSQARHGLEFAHQRGIVHRDLKPDNLFVAAARRRGVPFTIKVLDFGIAKWVHEVRGGVKNSQAMGTPSWMAPEQLSPGKPIAAGTDVWALGLLAFWMMTGKEYWLAANDDAGSVSSMLLELVTGTHEPASARAVRLGSPRVFPAGFDAWLERCLLPEAAQRFPDAASCIDALASVIEGAPPRSVPEIDLASVLSRDPSVPDELRRAVTGSEQKADDDRAWWLAHAAAATGGDTPELAQWLAKRKRPRPVARPLGPSGLRESVWAGPPVLHPLTALSEMLAEPLLLAAARTGRAMSSQSATARVRVAPDRVVDAVRHAALILGVQAEVVPISGAQPSFVIQSLDPLALGASSTLRAETSVLLLRARAAVGLARSRMGLGLVGVLGSAGELDEVRKAATALARGTISQSKYYRSLVSRLGARRDELASALEAAQSVPSDVWWLAAELTLARAALLACADLRSAEQAVAELVPGRPTEPVREALSRFVMGPTFTEFWHRPSTSPG
jgi:serine/threonine protein kinase